MDYQQRQINESNKNKEKNLGAIGYANRITEIAQKNYQKLTLKWVYYRIPIKIYTFASVYQEEETDKCFWYTLFIT